MSQQQAALLSLIQVNYNLGTNIGTSFTVTIQVPGENNTSIPVTIFPGQILTFNELLTAVELSQVGATTIPVIVTLNGAGPNGPVNGSGSGQCTIPLGSSGAGVTVNVMVPVPNNPPANIMFNFYATVRDYPVCYDPEWLCRNRYNYPAFSSWWCLGYSQLSDFGTLQPVLDMTSAITSNLSLLQTINTQLTLGYTAPPVGATFVTQIDYAMNVVLGAAPKIDQLTLRRKFQLSDFADIIDVRAGDFIGNVVDRLNVPTRDLCTKWRELLDCYCKLCRRWVELPVSVQDAFNQQAAPIINNAFPVFSSQAQTEGLQFSFNNSASTPCAKLMEIVSFWAWYCKICPIVSPTFESTFQTYYDGLYLSRTNIQQLLDAYNASYCQPPMQTFCNDWLRILNCLEALCARRAEIPSSVWSDLTSTFSTLIYTTAQATYRPATALPPPAAPSTFCDLVTWLRKYFTLVCGQKSLPGGTTQRQQLDDLLAMIKTAMTGFTSRNGDLCAPTVPMTNCSDFQAILPCLTWICNKKAEMTAGNLQSFVDNLDPVVTDLYNIITGGSVSPGGADMLCLRIPVVVNFFNSLCPSGAIDPIKRLRLLAKLSALQAAIASFIAASTNLCMTAVTFPSTSCDQWKTILDCLDRICAGSSRLPQTARDRVTSLFALLCDELDWLISDPTQSYSAPSGSLTLSSICSILYRLRNYITSICNYGLVDAIRKIRLDDLMSRFQSAYNTLLSEYPGICSVSTGEECGSWIEMFDCLARICDTWKKTPNDAHLLDLMESIDVGSGTMLHSIYVALIGAEPTNFSSTLEKACVEIHGILDYLVAHCACCGATLDSYKRGQVLELMILLQLNYRSLVLCGSGCGTTQVPLTTGTAPWVVTKIDDITLSRPATPNVVTGTSGIGTPVSGSQWISPHPTASDAHVGWTTFERCFCVCIEGNVQISITYLADDYAQISLDGTVIDTPTESNMHSSRTYTGTVYLSAGRHCIRAAVRNDPAHNMAFCASGSITSVTATLASDGCCGDGTTPVPNCGAAPVLDCARLATLARFHHLLCCPTRSLSDPIFSTQQYLNIVTKITCFESEIDWISLQLGMQPGSLPLGSTSFCDRFRRALRLVALAYAGYESLPVIVRVKVDCFYDAIRAELDVLATSTMNDAPICGDTCDICSGWLDAIGCLCRLGVQLPTIAGSSVYTQVQTLLCTDIGSYYTFLSGTYGSSVLPSYMGGAPADCFVTMRRAAVLTVIDCFCCSDMSGSHATSMTTWYNQIKPKLDQAMKLLATTSINCDDFCRKWIDAVECLLKFCLRRSELSPTQQTTFDTLIGAQATALHALVPGGSITTSPFTAGTFGNLCNGLYEIVLELYRRCTPYYAWSPTLRSQLDALYPGFIAAVNSVKSQFAGAGIRFCDESIDVCSRLSTLPEYYRLFCATTPSLSNPTVAAVDVLLTQMAASVPLWQKRLKLALTAYPASSSFCVRLEFMVDLALVAYSRIDELNARLRQTLELFYWLLRSSATAYRSTLTGQLPGITTMSRFRKNWLDPLLCLCNVCSQLGTLPPSVITIIEGTLGSRVQTIYDLILGMTTTAGLPVVALPCPITTPVPAATRCRQVRVLISFFAGFGLRYAEPPGSSYTIAMDQLNAVLPNLRSDIAALRAELQAIGRVICSEESFNDVAMQSPMLYLQAAGSDGSDGTVPGVDLRWKFSGDLEKHIPKGNMAASYGPYPASYGYNKADDFVRIHRVPYTQQFPAIIDFNSMTPSAISVPSSPSSTTPATWTFSGLKSDPPFTSPTTTLQLVFTNSSTYASVCGSRQPATNVADVLYIIQNYHDMIEIRTTGKPAFAVSFDIVAAGTPSVRVEGIAYSYRGFIRQATITGRKDLTGTGRQTVMGEGMETIRFAATGCHINAIRVETYMDFYVATKRRYAWEQIGSFSLSLDQTEVYRRLEDAAHYTVDGQWPKYASPLFTTPSQSGGKVNVQNYKDRWEPNSSYRGRTTAEGMRTAVEYYLNTSRAESGWEAKKTIDSDDPSDSSSIELSMLRMLNLVALDYHVARMLGWGHIDWEVAQSSFPAGRRYVYLAEYETPRNGGTPAMMHRYLSLPTSTLATDHRLPVKAEILGHDLGLPQFDPQTPPFTDGDGYTKYGDSRFIRFNRKDLRIDLAAGTAITSGASFGRADNTRPVFFGIRRREKSGGVYSPWIVPDVSNDGAEYASPGYQPYLDASGKPESTPIPDRENPIFTDHLVKDRDNHKVYNYGIYSINWFSRVSDIVPYADIANDFPKRNTILPPANLTALFLQPEPRQMFNSAYEQGATALHNTTRVTFDWTHVHNIAYQRATHVKFLFRTDPPQVIRGEIERIESIPGQNSVKVYTRAYKDPSTDDANGGATITPSLTIAGSRFVGSMLVTQSHRFVIDSVTTDTGGLALFTVRMEYAPKVDNPSAAEIDPTVPAEGGWYGPQANDRFMAAENFADPNNIWTKLNLSDLPLPDLTAAPYSVAAYTETGTDPNGRSITLPVGGIGRSAHIQEIFEPYPVGHPLYGSSYSTGVYKITFDVGGNFTLAPYAETLPSGIAKAEWYKGVVRIAEDQHADQIKVLDVVRIETATGPVNPSTPVTPLTVYAHDPLSDDPDHLIIPRTMGSTVTKSVNFHPGLRAYLKLSTNGINLANDVLPATGEKVRQTYIAAYAYESGTTNASPLTPPTVHIARTFDTPAVPQAPVGLLYATRPDVYGKSTYTFDTQIDLTARTPNGLPYSMVFLRGNDQMILRALYTQQTIDTVILPGLPPRGTEPSTVVGSRWMGLVNVDVEAAGANVGKFRTYGTSTFRFPNPDNPDTRILDRNNPGQFIAPFATPVTPGSAVQNVKDAIRQAFLPMTERAVPLEIVRRDDRLQTIGGKPVVRDANGDPLKHTDPTFDPFPMVRKGIDANGHWQVRFTDYTLDGASRNIYFYYAREIAGTLAVGEPGAVIGPVRLIDSSPAPTPVIRHVASISPDPVLGNGPEVRLEVAKFQENDQVVTVRIYRALAAEDALSLRAMTLVGDVTIPSGSGDSFTVADTFAGGTPPYGQAVYYRLASLRGIVNEQDLEELVPSLLSKTVIVTVIDTVNPASPTLSYTNSTPIGSPVQQLPNVVLSWNQTAARGTYHLYQMTSKGNWQKLDSIVADPSTPNAAITASVGTLTKRDADNNEVYNRFKVVAQNSSGLLSLDENVLVI